MKNVGILGGGQLARMMVLAGMNSGFRFKVLTNEAEDCVGDICQVTKLKKLTATSVNNFSKDCDVVTIENENVDCSLLEGIVKKISPNQKSIGQLQDRLKEKMFLKKMDIGHADYKKIFSLNDLRINAKKFGNDCVLKKRTYGYDGKNQIWMVPFAILDESKLPNLNDGDWILERRVNYDYEVSQVSCARWDNSNAEITHFPTTKNYHLNSILRQSDVITDENISDKTRAIATKIIKALKYTGTICIEMFVSGNKVEVNEIAPRVHNSGHWTIDGSSLSQFSAHLLAIGNYPVPTPFPLYKHIRMINIIGKLPNISKVLELSNVHLHIYGKKPRKNRKLGHITICTNSTKELSIITSKLNILLS